MLKNKELLFPYNYNKKNSGFVTEKDFFPHFLSFFHADFNHPIVRQKKTYLKKNEN